MKPSIFQFDDFRIYLKIAGPESYSENKRLFTYAKWSKDLGYSSHRAIAMVINGERLPSVDMIHRLSASLSLTPLEQQYFEHLILKERYSNQPDQKAALEERLIQLKPKQYQQENFISSETLGLIYPWYFFVIKQLAGCLDFRMEVSWIHKRLRQKVCSADIRRALEIMKHLKLIGQDAATQKWKELKSDLMTRSDVPSEALRSHHKGMLDRAKEALDEQPVDQRDVKALTLRFSKRDMPAAKNAIHQFLLDFNKKFSSEETDAVYQLGIQFFEHTSPDTRQ